GEGEGRRRFGRAGGRDRQRGAADRAAAVGGDFGRVARSQRADHVAVGVGGGDFGGHGAAVAEAGQRAGEDAVGTERSGAEFDVRHPPLRDGRGGDGDRDRRRAGDRAVGDRDARRFGSVELQEAVFRGGDRGGAAGEGDRRGGAEVGRRAGAVGDR